MSAPISPLFIVNPIAGSGRAHGYAPRIQAWLAEQGIDGRLLETRERGHAERLAAAATDLGHDRVIAVGGNDMARSVDLPIDPMACLPIAVGATSRRFDVGRATSDDGAVRHFGAAGGVGFDAQVAWTMAERRRWWMRGEAGYFLATLNELRRFRNAKLRITLESEEGDRAVDQAFLFVAFANGPFYGGGMQICPNAETDDGWLDVCLVGDLSRLEALRELPGIYQAKHVNNSKVEIVHARRVRIEGDGQARIHLDGEPFGTVPVVIDLLPGAVGVAVAGPVG
jgi:diacylglycerol kinase (ATP)